MLKYEARLVVQVERQAGVELSLRAERLVLPDALDLASEAGCRLQVDSGGFQAAILAPQEEYSEDGAQPRKVG